MLTAPSGSYWLETNLILWICGQFRRRMLLSLQRIKACFSLRHPHLMVTMWILPFSGCSRKFTAPFLRRNWNAATAKLMGRRCSRVPRLMLSLGLIWKLVRWRNYLLALVDFIIIIFLKKCNVVHYCWVRFLVYLFSLLSWRVNYVRFAAALWCPFMIGSMR